MSQTTPRQQRHIQFLRLDLLKTLENWWASQTEITMGTQRLYDHAHAFVSSANTEGELRGANAVVLETMHYNRIPTIVKESTDSPENAVMLSASLELLNMNWTRFKPVLESLSPKLQGHVRGWIDESLVSDEEEYRNTLQKRFRAIEAYTTGGMHNKKLDDKLADSFLQMSDSDQIGEAFESNVLTTEQQKQLKLAGLPPTPIVKNVVFKDRSSAEEGHVRYERMYEEARHMVDYSETEEHKKYAMAFLIMTTRVSYSRKTYLQGILYAAKKVGSLIGIGGSRLTQMIHEELVGLNVYFSRMGNYVTTNSAKIGEMMSSIGITMKEGAINLRDIATGGTFNSAATQYQELFEMAERAQYDAGTANAFSELEQEMSIMATQRQQHDMRMRAQQTETTRLLEADMMEELEQSAQFLREAEQATIDALGEYAPASRRMVSRGANVSTRIPEEVPLQDWFRPVDMTSSNIEYEWMIPTEKARNVPILENPPAGLTFEDRAEIENILFDDVAGPSSVEIQSSLSLEEDIDAFLSEELWMLESSGAEDFRAVRRMQGFSDMDIDFMELSEDRVLNADLLDGITEEEIDEMVALLRSEEEEEGVILREARIMGRAARNVSGATVDEALFVRIGRLANPEMLALLGIAVAQFTAEPIGRALSSGFHLKEGQTNAEDGAIAFNAFWNRIFAPLDTTLKFAGNVLLAATGIPLLFYQPDFKELGNDIWKSIKEFVRIDKWARNIGTMFEGLGLTIAAAFGFGDDESLFDQVNEYQGSHPERFKEENDPEWELVNFGKWREIREDVIGNRRYRTQVHGAPENDPNVASSVFVQPEGAGKFTLWPNGLFNNNHIRWEHVNEYYDSMMKQQPELFGYIKLKSGLAIDDPWETSDQLKDAVKVFHREVVDPVISLNERPSDDGEVAFVQQDDDMPDPHPDIDDFMNSVNATVVSQALGVEPTKQMWEMFINTHMGRLFGGFEPEPEPVPKRMKPTPRGMISYGLLIKDS